MIEFYEVAPPSAIGQIKAIRVAQSARKQLVFKLSNGEGQAVNLNAETQNPPAPAPDFSPEPAATDNNTSMRLRAKAGDLYGPAVFDIDGTKLPDEGFVSFQITELNTAYPGVFEATIGRFLPGGQLVDTWPVLIIIEANAFTQLCGVGPLTIPEIRYGLLDVENGTGGAPFNNLLDDVEFTDSEIIFAMRRIVDKWNETPPPVAYYTGMNFPYRYWWLQGTVAQLLIMGAARYRRNRLDYAAGGISINDQSKAEEYESVGRATMQEFDQWMLKEKTRINMDMCWGIGL